MGRSIALLLTGVSTAAIPVHSAAASLLLPQDPPAPAVDEADTPIQTAPQASRIPSGRPAGFEDVDAAIETVFDVYYQGRRVGVVPARVENGRVAFADPAALAAILPDADQTATIEFFRRDLPSNENLRCLPGEVIGCGVLQAGVSGVIVNPDNFRIDVFLGREFLTGPAFSGRILGDPISGPSVIQNIAGTVSATNSGSGHVRYGIGLDTLASLGRASAVSRIFGDDEQGLQLEEGYGQYYFDDYRIAGGMLQTQESLNLANLRFYGVEVSSFYGGQLDQNLYAATPIDVVLPRASRVEIYRNGVLVTTGQYDGGLQILDTSRLPAGSYPIRIVARDSSGVVLDEIRTFTRATDLPPPGRTVFNVRAGVRAADNLSSFLGIDESRPFAPESTGESVFSATASRRIGRAASASVGFTAVDGNIFPEASFQLYHGQLRAAVGAAVGPEGQYSAFASASFQYESISGSLNVRSVEAAPLTAADLARVRRYRPFLQSERGVYANIQMPVAGGSLGFRAALSESDFAGERYNYGVSYTRPITFNRFGTGFLSFDAVSSDIEDRVGLRLTFLRGAGPRATLSMSGGGEYISSKSAFEDDGFYPIALVGYSRSGMLNEVEVSGSASAGVSNGDTGLQLAGLAASRLGEIDVYTGVTRSRLSDETETFFTGNVNTGFLYGGGVMQWGSRGIGDAAILVDLKADERARTDGRFRVLIDDLPQQSIKPNQRAAIAMAAFTRPRVGLSPEAAPPFDIDLTPREVPLYPGNVVRIEWAATTVITVYGRLLDAQGFAIPGARIESGTDVSVTNDDGYFSLTGPAGAILRARRAGGGVCEALTTIRPPADGSPRAVVPLGDLRCVAPTQGERPISGATP